MNFLHYFFLECVGAVAAITGLWIGGGFGRRRR